MQLDSILASRARCLILLAVVATALYLNTLPAGFTFDDNFAVVRFVNILAASRSPSKPDYFDRLGIGFCCCWHCPVA